MRRAAAARTFLVAAAVLGVLRALLVLLQAALIADTVAGVFETRSLDGVERAAGWLLVVFAARGLLGWLTTAVSQRAAADVKSQLRLEVMRARLGNPVSSRTSPGTLVSVVTQGLDALDGYFGRFLPQLLLAVTVPVIAGVAVGLRDATSAVIVAVTVPLIPVFMVLIGWTTETRVKRRFAVQTRLANHFADLISGLATLQVFGRAITARQGLARSENAHRSETMGTLRVAFLSAFVLELAATLSVALIAVTIGFRVLYGSLDLATALYVLVVAPEVYLPIRMVGVHFHDSANGSAAADAAFAAIDATPVPVPAPEERDTESHREGLDALRTGSRVLEFAEVSFCYPGGAGIRNLSFDVAPGEVVALTGPSGAGKTTVLALVMGFLAADSGTVRVGCDIAYVAQEPGMLRGTVADNVRLGWTNATETELRQALDVAGGVGITLDRHVGDAGEGLSAGERRRVALARALLRVRLGSAGLLVLDEPTAGLDADTEEQAVRAIRALKVAALIVSHRQAVLELADKSVPICDLRNLAEPESGVSP
ncbi:MAG: thiol reductant ABC exporter subunit CydD [Propionibacteriaceae bacterium]|jgi:ATP-binding cassette subfamily C protein CydCD|nr:thiol reductant ABC exporter subunit CydD [Propionibacteriaceae bacterium]